MDGLWLDKKEAMFGFRNISRQNPFETYLLSKPAKFSSSAKRNMKARFKPYAVDTGLRNRVAFSFSEDMGWLAENVVLNHLKERFEEIFYDSNGGEVDFLVKEGTRIIMRVQVWYADPVETTIPDRELKGFGQRGKTLEKAEKLILTNDLEQVQKVGGETARCLPLTLNSLPA
jgi:predicted AAA+ superfamily ATPase